MPRYATRSRRTRRRTTKRRSRKRFVKRRAKATYTGKRGRFTGPRPRPAKSTFAYHPWIGADKSLHFPVPRQLKLVPARIRAKLIYQRQRSTTVAVGLNTQQYRGNSVFDPDLTGTGQQPRGFDEYSVLYSKYYVVGSSISINTKVIAGADPIMVCVFAYSTAPTTDMPNITLAADPQNWYAQDRVKCIMPATADNSTDTFGLKMAVKTKSAIPKGTEREDLVTGVGTNPNSEWFYSVNMQRAFDSSGNALELWITETVVYDVIFSSPNPFAES